MLTEMERQTLDTAPQANLPGLKLHDVLAGHRGRIGRIAWSPSAWVLASGSDDQTIRVWDIEHGRCLRTLQGYPGSAHSLSWAPARWMLAANYSGYSIRIWDVRRGKVLQLLSGHTRSVCSVAWSPDGHTLISGAEDHTLRIWRAGHRQAQRVIEGYCGIGDIVWSPRSRIFAAGSADHSLCIWHSETGRVLQTFEGHTRVVLGIAWSPDGQWLVSGSDDNTIRIWQVATGGAVQTLGAHTDSVTCVSFSNDGRLLASKSKDGTVRLWRCDRWEPVAVLAEPSGDSFFSGLAFHRHWPVLATLGENDTALRIWHADIDLLLGAPAAADADPPPPMRRFKIPEFASTQEPSVVPSSQSAPFKTGPSTEASPAAEQAVNPEILSEQRKRFKKAIARLKAVVGNPDQQESRLRCFVSHAWGETEHERWTQRFADDLRTAGIDPLLDRRSEIVIDANARLLNHIPECNIVIVVGTPLYRRKYDDKLTTAGSVVAAELYLINMRLMSTEVRKRTVWPVLLEGDEASSLPAPLHGRLCADFRQPENYYPAIFDLLLRLYGIPLERDTFADARQALRTVN